MLGALVFEHIHQLRPFFALVLHHVLEDGQVFLISPVSSNLCLVQMIHPSLPAVLRRSEDVLLVQRIEVPRNLVPFSPVKPTIHKCILESFK